MKKLSVLFYRFCPFIFLHLCNFHIFLSIFPHFPSTFISLIRNTRCPEHHPSKELYFHKLYFRNIILPKNYTSGTSFFPNFGRSFYSSLVCEASVCTSSLIFVSGAASPASNSASNSFWLIFSFFISNSAHLSNTSRCVSMMCLAFA